MNGSEGGAATAVPPSTRSYVDAVAEGFYGERTDQTPNSDDCYSVTPAPDPPDPPDVTWEVTSMDPDPIVTPLTDWLGLTLTGDFDPTLTDVYALCTVPGIEVPVGVVPSNVSASSMRLVVQWLTAVPGDGEVQLKDGANGPVLSTTPLTFT